MKTYSGFHALYMSFFSKDLYRNVVRNWKGIAFLYLFLLVMSSWALISLKCFFVINEAMTGPVKKIIDKLPVVTIHDGELKIDKPSPYVLTIPTTVATNTGKENVDLPIAAFDDTTDDVKGQDATPFLLTKHNFLVQSKEGKAQQIELKQFGDVKYTKQNYKEIADAITLWIPIVIFFICGPVLFIINAVLALIVGAMGMAVAGGMNVKLTYGEIVRIASVAFTPAIIFDTAVKLVGLPLNMIWIIIPFCLALAYTIFGVLANKEPIIVDTSMPGGMPHTADNFSPQDDVPPTPPDNTTPMT